MWSGFRITSLVLQCRDLILIVAAPASGGLIRDRRLLRDYWGANLDSAGGIEPWTRWFLVPHSSIPVACASATICISLKEMSGCLNPLIFHTSGWIIISFTNLISFGADCRYYVRNILSVSGKLCFVSRKKLNFETAALWKGLKCESVCMDPVKPLNKIGTGQIDRFDIWNVREIVRWSQPSIMVIWSSRKHDLINDVAYATAAWFIETLPRAWNIFFLTWFLMWNIHEASFLIGFSTYSLVQVNWSRGKNERLLRNGENYEQVKACFGTVSFRYRRYCRL